MCPRSFLLCFTFGSRRGFLGTSGSLFGASSILSSTGSYPSLSSAPSKTMNHHRFLGRTSGRGQSPYRSLPLTTLAVLPFLAKHRWGGATTAFSLASLIFSTPSAGLALLLAALKIDFRMRCSLLMASTDNCMYGDCRVGWCIEPLHQCPLEKPEFRWKTIIPEPTLIKGQLLVNVCGYRAEDILCEDKYYTLRYQMLGSRRKKTKKSSRGSGGVRAKFEALSNIGTQVLEVLPNNRATIQKRGMEE